MKMKKVKVKVKVTWRPPWLTLAVGLVMVIIAVGNFHHVGEWQRGEAWWRLITSHFTHWTPTHFAWDFLAWVCLAGLAEVFNRRRLAWALGLTLLLTVPMLIFIDATLMAYRGASAIACAAAGLLACMLWKSGKHSRPASVGILAVVVGKPVFEAWSGTSVFAELGDAQVLPFAHIIPACIGVAVGCFPFSSVLRQPSLLLNSAVDEPSRGNSGFK